jgi:hypothetical protein
LAFSWAWTSIKGLVNIEVVTYRLSVMLLLGTLLLVGLSAVDILQSLLQVLLLAFSL